mmetsp:Transcript_43027/g.102148  ORF Transcript_43027/g.102148 Transcript_43027/m.102148 type:complete len:357 (-) Transcript_43027:208-1278(-)
MKDIDSRFGKGTIWKLGTSSLAQIETFPSGVLPLDAAMGGGYPRGRIIEIYGPESSGKTTLALHAIAEMQKAGGTAALVDAEHAFEPVYAKNLGVNIDDLLVTQPFSGEDALNIVDNLVRSMTVDVIAVDSVAALVPRAELEGEIGQVQVGAQARLMSSALRKLVANASKCNCTVIFLNQLRQKVGVIYGNPEVTSGGNALKYYASVRIDVRRKETIKASGEEVGIRCKASIKKNKVAPPYRVVEFDIMFNAGISMIGALLDSAVASNVIARKGAWYSYGSTKLGNGREKTLQFLEANPEILREIDSKAREAVKQGRAEVGYEAPGASASSSTDEFAESEDEGGLIPPDDPAEGKQ